jgi:hypothetical protein
MASWIRPFCIISAYHFAGGVKSLLAAKVAQ